MEVPAGAPVVTRAEFLPFAHPDLDGSELAEIREVLESGWLSSGPKAKAFEEEFARAVGAPHAVAVNSATAGMHVSLVVAGLGPGDESIVPAYTFAATAEVVLYLGATPVLVDVDPVTLNVDPAAVEAAVTGRTRAVLPVHFGGLAADLDGIGAVAGRHDLVVVEDAAHAFPAAYRGRPIGSISPYTCFSFYATKTITTGEGGMVTTDREDRADLLRSVALHGIDRNAWNRYSKEGSWFYRIERLGFKYNMTDVAAAMGLAQLPRADAMRERRADVARLYDEAFAPLEELQTPTDLDDRAHAWHIYGLRLNLDRLSIDRADFIEALHARNIGASVHFIPVHLHPYYARLLGHAPEDFPVAYGEYMREVSLPIWSKMEPADVADVTAAVAEVVAAHRKKVFAVER
ncbi:MAG TPA: DegT/DnrJ/EryC1/StrS family aminotransferase [Gemmatimonadota bacterium]|nr:DegT/DnrJ/EryC1/StrS family aminotransferase [Gemmatimonadota bacterium]